MSATRDQLESFQQFAAKRLASAVVEPSFDELLIEWQDLQEREEIDEAIRRGIADFKAGRHEPAEQVMASLREEFGFKCK